MRKIPGPLIPTNLPKKQDDCPFPLVGNLDRHRKKRNNHDQNYCFNHEGECIHFYFLPKLSIRRSSSGCQQRISARVYMRGDSWF